MEKMKQACVWATDNSQPPIGLLLTSVRALFVLVTYHVQIASPEYNNYIKCTIHLSNLSYWWQINMSSKNLKKLAYMTVSESMFICTQKNHMPRCYFLFFFFIYTFLSHSVSWILFISYTMAFKNNFIGLHLGSRRTWRASHVLDV